ncbi:hypothetical protein F4805DRAFT_415008 [Annulohypoxylon moriforme]|nr:hypothetical protein F4805DRAFT_415008 [Annulohypoxylon moriforme]
MQIPSLSTMKALTIYAGLQRPLTGRPPSGLPEAPSPLKPIPGGSPFSFCEVSRSTDLFQISSVEISQQPVYIDDVFLVFLYGTFQESFSSNATFTFMEDCGSHCEDYGNPPGERPGGTLFTMPFCNMSLIEQPLGGRPKKDETCPPEEGYALVKSMGYVMPMVLRTPGWYNFTIDAKTAEGERIYCLTTEVCLRWEDEEKNKGYPPGPWSDCRWPR